MVKYKKILLPATILFLPIVFLLSQTIVNSKINNNNSSRKYFENISSSKSTDIFQIDDLYSEFIATATLLGIYELASGNFNPVTGLYKKDDVLLKFLSGDRTSYSFIASVEQAFLDLADTSSEKIAGYEVKYISLGKYVNIPIISMVSGAKPLNWNPDINDYTNTNFFYWIDNFMTNYGKHDGWDPTEGREGYNLYSNALNFTGDGFTTLSKNITIFAKLITRAKPDLATFLFALNKAFAIFTNLQNTTSLSYYTQSHSSDFVAKQQRFLEFSPIFLAYWNNFQDNLKNGSGGVILPVTVLASFASLIKDIDKPIESKPKYDLTSLFVTNQITEIYLPIFSKKLTSELESIYILNFFPSANDILQKINLFSIEDEYFLNPDASRVKLDINEHLDIIESKLLPVLSSINIKAVEYLKQLYDLVNQSIQIDLRPFMNEIFNFRDNYLISRTFNKNILGSKSEVNAYFHSIKVYSDLISNETVNYLFNHNLPIPPDPWGTKINPVRGSNIILFILIILVLILIIGYISINYHLIKNDNDLPEYTEYDPNDLSKKSHKKNKKS